MKHVITFALLLAANTTFAANSVKSKKAVLSSPEVQTMVLAVAKMRGLECSTPKLDYIKVTALDEINEKFSIPVMCDRPMDPTTGQGGGQATSVTVTGFVYGQTSVRVFGLEIKEFE